jgi:hypothetical protein
MPSMRFAAVPLLVLAAAAPGCGAKAAGSDDAGGVADADPNRPDGQFDQCAQATYGARQQPASMLVVLDRSESMGMQNKYTFAAQAIVSALDRDVFDGMSVGLYAAPSADVTGPSCIFGLPVPCQAPPFPVIDLADTGTDKSSAPSGVRRAIKDWLTANGPFGGAFGGDASPLYGGLVAAIGALQAGSQAQKRILFVVTDGSISCTQLSSRPGFLDCNGCERDWEDPQNIIDLLAAANTSATSPIETFVVGVPGADTNPGPSCTCQGGGPGCNEPPYSMRLALSAMAHAGAPSFVPADCDGTTFTQAGGDPTKSCHFDMTQGFTAAEMADAIAHVRGETLGCVFELPEPPDGSTIDRNEVNVEYRFDGSPPITVPRRSDPLNPCTGVECWDYDAGGDVELLGLACQNVKGATSVEVRIVVGCQTIVL